MELKEFIVILLADLVTGKNDDILGIISSEEAQILINGIGSSLVPVGILSLLIGRKDMNTSVKSVQIPGLSVSDILIENKRLILRKDTDGVDTGINTVRKREINNAILTAERHSRFSQLIRQRIESRSLSPGKDHSYHFLCHICVSLKNLAYKKT